MLCVAAHGSKGIYNKTVPWNRLHLLPCSQMGLLLVWGVLAAPACLRSGFSLLALVSLKGLVVFWPFGLCMTPVTAF